MDGLGEKRISLACAMEMERCGTGCCETPDTTLRIRLHSARLRAARAIERMDQCNSMLSFKVFGRGGKESEYCNSSVSTTDPVPESLEATISYLENQIDNLHEYISFYEKHLELI